MSIQQSVEKFYLTYSRFATYWIAYSGGLDSHVLLHAFASLRKLYPISVRAVHINHRLSPNANHWADHSAAVCQALNVDFVQKSVELDLSQKESLEEVARRERYRVLSSLLVENDIVLTAHHQADQAETLLLQLIRGAGPKGLAAMPVIKRLGGGMQGRPLLLVSRENLEQYAKTFQLAWIEDESNSNTAFARNFLRHQVIPLLKTRWPKIESTLARVASHCAEAQEIIEGLAEADLANCLGNIPHTLSVKCLLNLPIIRQKQVIRLWLDKAGAPLPSAVKIDHIQQDVLHAAVDKMPCVTWLNVSLRRYQDNLYLLKESSPHDAKQIYIWQVDQPLILPNVGVLQAVKNASLLTEAAPLKLNIRFRQGGEVCQLPGHTCHHALKKLFQEWQVPPWVRDKIPLIYRGDELVMVAGYYQHAAFSPALTGYEITFHPYFD